MGWGQRGSVPVASHFWNSAEAEAFRRLTSCRRKCALGCLIGLVEGLRQ